MLHPHKIHEHYLRAFSLIEILIVIFITSILLLIALPNWHDLYTKTTTQTRLETLVEALQLTRTEAIRRGEGIIFCKSKDQKTCGGDWQDGQIIVDYNNHVIRSFPALPKGDKLIWESSFGNNDAIIFSPTGATKGQQGTFYYYPAGDQQQSKGTIVVQESGVIGVRS
jgi:type IV fimbrial biogenesis protein FimT